MKRAEITVSKPNLNNYYVPLNTFIFPLDAGADILEVYRVLLQFASEMNRAEFDESNPDDPVKTVFRAIAELGSCEDALRLYLKRAEEYACVDSASMREQTCDFKNVMLYQNDIREVKINLWLNRPVFTNFSCYLYIFPVFEPKTQALLELIK